MQTVQDLSIATPSGPLAATRWGTGTPAAVLLHAGVTDRRGFAELATYQRTGSLLAYDRRGFGDTPDAATDPLDDLAAVLDSVGAPVWLVGSSQGGALALRAALELPQRVRGLVLLSPAVPGLALGDVDADTVALDTAADEARTAGNVEAVLVFEAHLWLDGPQQAEGRVRGPARELFANMDRIVVERELGGDDMSTEPVEVWARVKEIAVPVVVAAGEYDVPALVERARTLAREVGGHWTDLAASAHLPYLDDPGAVAAVLADAMD